MKKLAVFFTFLVCLPLLSRSQVMGGDDRFSKLFDLYVMEKYEDCAYKAESMTMNDKYKRDPEPYLYLSMCFYYIYENIDDFDAEQYKNAFKDCMKYAYKCKQKSDYRVKKGKCTADKSIFAQNQDYYDKLKKLCIQEANAYLIEENYRKAASTYKSLSKVAPDDYNVFMMKGICEILAMNVGQGGIDIKNATAIIKQGFDSGTFKTFKISEYIGIDAYIKYTDWLVEQNMPDSARVTIELASKVYKDDKDIQNQYAKLNQ